MNTLEKIGLVGLVPVVVINDEKDAVPAAEALLEGGLDIMEITMRTDAGIQAIKNVTEGCPDMLVGAGTVLTLDKCKEAVEVGAKFIVSPGFNEKIVAWCLENNVTVTPGCVTPTEIEAALSYGIKILKFFPAGTYGGIQACKSLYDPYRSAGVSFIPTGGVNNDNLTEYANKPYIHAIGGSWLCPSSAIDNHDFISITENACKAIDILLGFEVAHIGINQDSKESSLNVANRLNKAFNFMIREGNSSNFAGAGIEIMNAPYLGTHGHIAIHTNSIKRASYYIGRRGYELDETTAKVKDGKIVSVYLKDEFGGFAVHLLQK